MKSRGQSVTTLILVIFILGWVLWRSSVPRGQDRSLGQLVTEFSPVLLAAGLALFLRFSNRRQQLGVLLSFVFPGCGHLYLGWRPRGIFFAATLVPLFVAGMAMAGFANISPFDRHPIWGLSQVPGGLMTVVAGLLTGSVKIIRDNPYYTVGCLFTGTACLLNILAMCDIWDLEETKPPLAPAGSTSSPTPPGNVAA